MKGGRHGRGRLEVRRSRWGLEGREGEREEESTREGELSPPP